MKGYTVQLENLYTVKNKKSLYILIPLTLMVWGIIGYRILNHVRSEDNTVVYSKTNISDANLFENTPDTFFIENNYADPFLKGTFSVSRRPDPVKQTSNKKPTPTPNRIAMRRRMEEQNLRWPNVIYNGLIINEKDQTQTVLVSINGKQKLMKPLEECDGVKVLKIYNDSLRIGYQEQEKSIAKNVSQQL